MERKDAMHPRSKFVGTMLADEYKRRSVMERLLFLLRRPSEDLPASARPTS